jgi:hypothetical protein
VIQSFLNVLDILIHRTAVPLPPLGEGKGVIESTIGYSASIVQAKNQESK